MHAAGGAYPFTEASDADSTFRGHHGRDLQPERYPDYATTALNSPWASPRATALSSVDEQLIEDADSSSWTAPVTRATALSRYPHLLAPIAVLFTFDRACTVLFQRLQIQFPSSLFGVSVVLVALCALDRFRADNGASVIEFFDPVVYWVARWMPVFFVPSLVVLPLSAAAFSSQELATVGAAIAIAWALTLLAAAGTAKTLRHFLHTELTQEEVRLPALSQLLWLPPDCTLPAPRHRALRSP